MQKSSKSKCGCCCKKELANELEKDAKKVFKLAKEEGLKLKAEYDKQPKTTQAKIKKGLGIAAASIAGIILAKKALKKK